MTRSRLPKESSFILPRQRLEDFLRAVSSSGYELVGPTIRDGTIRFERIADSGDLPVGWSDRQDRGSYGLYRRPDERVFGFANGPTSPKNWLYPPKRQVWSAVRRGSSLVLAPARSEVPRIALVGLRACDLRAIEVLDRVLLSRRYVDEDYRARRESALLVAVNCSDPSANCFCTSVGSGPQAQAIYDLCLTELLDKDGHRFVVEVGSHKGKAIVDALELAKIARHDIEAFNSLLEQTEAKVEKSVETDRLQEILYGNTESPRWKETSKRCLTCGNCTLSCPTCFCTNVEDHMDLQSKKAERYRTWDSCFNSEFAYIHGGSVRQSPESRYRQWLTHKFAAWLEQFGSLGCVGCGRCITWCPAGIDVTQELAALRQAETPTEQGNAPSSMNKEAARELAAAKG